MVREFIRGHYYRIDNDCFRNDPNLEFMNGHVGAAETSGVNTRFEFLDPIVEQKIRSDITGYGIDYRWHYNTNDRITYIGETLPDDIEV